MDLVRARYLKLTPEEAWKKHMGYTVVSWFIYFIVSRIWITAFIMGFNSPPSWKMAFRIKK